jgi:hypothetical protein
MEISVKWEIHPDRNRHTDYETEESDFISKKQEKARAETRTRVGGSTVP